MPGWGFDGRIIELAEQEFGWLYPTALLNPETAHDEIIALLAERQILGSVDLVGWSMGANLAVDFARANPDRVSTLYLLAMRRQWSASEIEAIRRELVANPHDFLSSFYRKCFLGYKKGYNRFENELQDQYLQHMDLGALLDGLDYLKRSQAQPVPGCEVHCVHGRRDIIAPVDDMAQVPGSLTTILDHAGHLVFLGKGFTLPEKRRKKAIRYRFSKAAATYDAHAEVQKELAQRLADSLGQDCNAETILEVGCGTGTYTELLARKFPAARIVGVDFSPAMLREAKRKLQTFPRIILVCEDGENFLAGALFTFDLITANSTIQWFDNIDSSFGDVKRLLNEKGIFLGTMFGPETLHELGEGLAYVFGEGVRLPSSRFISREDLEKTLSKHFERVEVMEWRAIRQYATLRALLAHIRKTGTGGWQPLPPVLTPGRLKRMSEWFIAQYGDFRLTYQAFLVRCR